MDKDFEYYMNYGPGESDLYYYPSTKEEYFTVDDNSDEYYLKHISIDSEEKIDPDYKDITLFLTGETMRLVGYKVIQIQDNDNGDIYLIGRLDSEFGVDSEKNIMVCGYLAYRTSVFNNQDILNLKKNMKRHNIETGIVVSNRSCFKDTKTLANNNNISFIKGYDIEETIGRFMSLLLSLTKALTEKELSNKKISDDWYLTVDTEYLKTYFKVLGYKVLIPEEMNHTEEKNYKDILSMDKRNNGSFIRIYFSNEPIPDKNIIEEMQESVNYYCGNNMTSGYYQNKIIISNQSLSGIDFELAKKNKIVVLEVPSVRTMLRELLEYSH